jgi:hypothetical protein
MLVYQSPHKHLDEIVTLLGTTPRKPHPISGVVPVSVARADIKALLKFYEAKDDLPSLCAGLSPDAAEAMWDAMFKAEGCTTGRDGAQHFAQNPGPVGDAFQILSTLTGRSAWRDARGVSVRKTRYLGVKEGIGTLAYTGVVWCPRTPTGTWVMRTADGAVMPTGNTWTRKSVPLYLGEIFRQPGKFNRWQHLVDGISASAGDAEAEEIPDWMRQGGGVVMPQGVSDALASLGLPGYKEGQTSVYMPDMPWQSAQEVLRPASQAAGALGVPGLGKNPDGFIGMMRELRTALGIGGPAGAGLAALGEVPAGGQSFTGKRLEPGQYTEVGYPLRWLPGITKRQQEPGGEQVPVMEDSLLYALEQAAPGLSKLRSIAPVSEQDESKAGRRWASLLSGLNVWPIDENTRRGAAYEDLETLQQLQKYLEGQGFVLPDVYEATKRGAPSLPPLPSKKKSKKKGAPIQWGSLTQ